jgi:hypothetical protein
MDDTGKVSAGTTSRLRTFDPVRLADLEYRAWVGYYLRRWPQVLIASVGLVRAGFGMDWYLTLHGAWLVLRASPAKAAELEVDWWRVHREGQRREGSQPIDDAAPAEERLLPAEYPRSRLRSR